MIEDSAYFVVIMFGIMIALVVIFVGLDAMNDGIQNEANIPADAKSQLNTFTSKFPTVFDFGFLTLVIVVFIAILALVYFLEINPLLFFAVLFVIVILGAVAGYLANAWITTMSTGALSAAVTNFPITNFILSNYMAPILLLAFLMFIVYYAKPQGGAQ